VLRQYKSSITNPSAPSLWVEDFVWRNGLLLGSQRPLEMGGRRHFHLDHLGTPRLVTSDDGQLVSYHDYYPFGDEHSPVAQEVPSGFDREDPLKFTGHERDYAGGMGGEDGHAVDYMHARYYNPSVGRLLSVDPVEGDPSRPQSWNRYAYVMNNPLNRVDPTGRCGEKADFVGVQQSPARKLSRHRSRNNPRKLAAEHRRKGKSPVPQQNFLLKVAVKQCVHTVRTVERSRMSTPDTTTAPVILTCTIGTGTRNVHGSPDVHRSRVRSRNRQSPQRSASRGRTCKRSLERPFCLLVAR
jgi:RHS repeat-associated protein